MVPSDVDDGAYVERSEREESGRAVGSSSEPQASKSRRRVRGIRTRAKSRGRLIIAEYSLVFPESVQCSLQSCQQLRVA